MSDSSRGTLLLVVIATATVVLTAAIAAFCALGSWTLLPVMMATLLITTGCVVAVLVEVMGDDQPDAAEAPEPAPVAARPVALGR